MQVEEAAMETETEEAGAAEEAKTTDNEVAVKEVRYRNKFWPKNDHTYDNCIQQ